jgi:hypothetical protein
MWATMRFASAINLSDEVLAHPKIKALEDISGREFNGIPFSSAAHHGEKYTLHMSTIFSVSPSEYHLALIDGNPLTDPIS